MAVCDAHVPHHLLRVGEQLHAHRLVQPECIAQLHNPELVRVVVQRNVAKVWRRNTAAGNLLPQRRLRALLAGTGR
jgi:hypothetical protein